MAAGAEATLHANYSWRAELGTLFTVGRSKRACETVIADPLPRTCGPAPAMRPRPDAGYSAT
jgi:hypothetical protein